MVTTSEEADNCGSTQKQQAAVARRARDEAATPWRRSCATPLRGSASPLSPLGSTLSARPPTTASTAPQATTTTRSPPEVK
ncbi:hypothetical protein ZWY2020_057706 [Hordeum vulgare]|nr:hypothetical protein ZWY2020_057706 [Hordeum vulgare]